MPDVQVVVPSRGRSRTILRDTLSLFPSALVTVEEKEMDDYLAVLPREQLLPHPPLSSLPAIRNWIFDNVHSELLVQADDDVYQVNCLVGWRPRRYRDPSVALQMIESSAVCALDAGCGFFGYSLNWAPRFFDPGRPFALNRGLGHVLGFVGDHGLRGGGPETALLEDMDLTLQALLKHRIVWNDQRWFIQCRPLMAGGLERVETSKSEQREQADQAFAVLQRRWGQYIVRQDGDLNAGPRVRRTTSGLIE